MRAFFSNTSKVDPGGLDTALEVAARAAKVVGAHGGVVRLFLATAAGEAVDTTLFSVEYESPEQMSRALDAMSGDEEVHRIRMTPSGSTQVSSTMSIELHGPSSTAAPGSVLEVHVSAVVPGRMEQWLADSIEVCEFVESRGARNARVLQLTYAGMASGMGIMLWEHADMVGQAQVGASWFEPSGLALQQKGMAADAPSTRAGSMLYQEIPL